MFLFHDYRYAILKEDGTFKVLSGFDVLTWIRNVTFNLNRSFAIHKGEIIFEGTHNNGNIVYVYPISPKNFTNNYIVFHKSGDKISYSYADNELDIPSDVDVLVARI